MMSLEVRIYQKPYSLSDFSLLSFIYSAFVV